MKAQSRIPSLDGLRAFSIALVLLSHVQHSLWVWQDSFVTAQIELLGNLGVRIFFEISGFLITTLLLDEYARSGTISFRRFYLRRTLRVFPAFYVFVACILGASTLGWVHLHYRDYLHALTYTMNYHPDRAWYLGHIWSLAVEEQFYFLWPLVLFLLGPRKGLYAAAATLLLAPLVRSGTYQFLPASREGIGETFQTVADTISAGCVLAGGHAWLGKNALYLKLTRGWPVLLLPFFALVLRTALRHHPHFTYLISEPLLNVAIALGLDWCLRYPQSLPGKMLNAKGIAFLGTISYSLYLWQQPFFNSAKESWLCQVPISLIVAFVAALLSYYLVETPVLRLRERLEPLLLSRSSVPSPAQHRGQSLP